MGAKETGDWRLKRADALRTKADKHSREAKGFQAVTSWCSIFTLAGAIALGIGIKHDDLQVELFGGIGVGCVAPAFIYNRARRREERLAESYRDQASQLETQVVAREQAETLGMIVTETQLDAMVQRHIVSLLGDGTLSLGQSPAQDPRTGD